LLLSICQSVCPINDSNSSAKAFPGTSQGGSFQFLPIIGCLLHPFWNHMWPFSYWCINNQCESTIVSEQKEEIRYQVTYHTYLVSRGNYHTYKCWNCIWSNNMQSLVIWLQNFSPFVNLHHAHVRKDTRLSSLFCTASDKMLGELELGNKSSSNFSHYKCILKAVRVKMIVVWVGCACTLFVQFIYLPAWISKYPMFFLNVLVTRAPTVWFLFTWLALC